MDYMSYYRGGWVVEIGDEFEPEFFALQEDVRTEILALASFSNNLGRNWGGPASIRWRARVAQI